MSFSRYVAGTYKIDRVGDLKAPDIDAISQQSLPNKPILRPGEDSVDFSNSDTQYERYKNLIQSNFYNLNANTSAYMPEMSRPQFAQGVNP